MLVKFRLLQLWPKHIIINEARNRALYYTAAVHLGCQNKITARQTTEYLGPRVDFRLDRSNAHYEHKKKNTKWNLIWQRRYKYNRINTKHELKKKKVKTSSTTDDYGLNNIINLTKSEISSLSVISDTKVDTGVWGVSCIV